MAARGEGDLMNSYAAAPLVSLEENVLLISFCHIPLRPTDDAMTGGDVGGRQQAFRGEGRTAQTKMNAAGVSTMARRMIKTEWARARRKSRGTPRADADLERQAKRWKRQQQLG